MFWKIFWRFSVLLFIIDSSKSDKIEIIKSFNGVVTDGSQAVIAVKTTGDRITKCEWSNQRGDVYKSDDNNPRGIKVSIEERSTLCKLEFSSANRQVEGNWSALVRAKCDFISESSKIVHKLPITTPGSYYKTDPNDTVNFFPAPLRVIPKAQSLSWPDNSDRLELDRDGCGNMAELDVNLKIAEFRRGVSEPFSIGPAQPKVYSREGEEAVLTMRSNIEFLGCLAKFKSRSVVEMKNQQRACQNYERTEICVEFYVDKEDNIYSCLVKIARVNSRLEGTWDIELSHRVGRSDESELSSIDLSLVELPSAVKLTLGRFETEYSTRDDRRGSNEELSIIEGDRVSVECSVEGGVPQPSPVLLMNRDKFIMLDQAKSCRNAARGEICKEFEFKVNEGLDRQELQCGFTMPLHDLSPRDHEEKRATATVSIDRDERKRGDDDEITLVDTNGSNLEICERNLEEGDRYTMEVRFMSVSRPFDIEWEASYRTRNSIVIPYNTQTSGYRNGRYTFEGRDVYVASLIIDRVSNRDIEDDFLLTVENIDRRRSEFVIDLSNSRNCNDNDKDFCKYGDRDCICTPDRKTCCDNSRTCRGDDCCFVCNPRRDQDCKCDGDYCCDASSGCRGKQCCEDKSDIKGCDPSADGRDCICDRLKSTCCDISRRCEGPNCCVECDDRADSDCDICEGRRCYKLKESISDKVKEVFVESCLDLSTIILNLYNPDGSERRRSISDREFRRKVEDFFEAVKCAGFSEEVLDKLSSRGSENRPGLFSGSRNRVTFKSAPSRTSSSSSRPQAQSFISLAVNKSQEISHFHNFTSPSSPSAHNQLDKRINSKVFGNERRSSATGSGD